MMLLIVDDNPAVRRMIVRIIGDLADDIRECSDGAGAIAAYRQFHPDLILMDVEMKGMDGITATREITRDFPEARVIVVTQHNDEMLRAAASAAGARGYVHKANLLAIREMIGTPQNDGHSGNE
jgi:CheY-like chemotaxis protein